MNSTIDFTKVTGWGIDADDRNEPTYPMKKYTGDDHQRLNYERPVQQRITGEELHSNERPNMSAVFGTTLPPSGISGAMRRYAFRYSENHYVHWLTLMIADRVNVVEAIFGDLRRGRLPNIFAEKGGRARWKYDGAEMTKKLIFTLAFAVTLYALNKKRRRVA